MNDFFLEPLFVLEMANNHMGSLSHGKRILEEFARVVRPFPYRFAFKFQLRNLDTFLHPNYRGPTDHKQVQRFTSTRLGDQDFASLKSAAEQLGFLTICTPFDEPSVDRVDSMGFAAIKIASCSFSDWPLLEQIAKTNRPLIASTAGASLETIDNISVFLRNRGKTFALLHCVGEYPTAPANFQMNQIDLLRERYPMAAIGFSTHEAPDMLDSLPLAIAKGARIFEKHVGVATEKFSLNAYSACPEQIEKWLRCAERAFEICGGPGSRRSASTSKEQADLRQFKRGVFASKRIVAGEKITQDNTFLAFPCSGGQLLANDLSKFLIVHAIAEIPENGAVAFTSLRMENQRVRAHEIVDKAKKLLAESNTMVPGMAEMEISHHYGLDQFGKYGCVLINVVNRAYCKKFILQFAGQTHPEQFHRVKEETFVVLHGELTLTLNGETRECRRGDVVTVGKDVRHSFSTRTGVVVEEISSTHLEGDSFYTDPEITKNKERKTVLQHWVDME